MTRDAFPTKFMSRDDLLIIEPTATVKEDRTAVIALRRYAGQRIRLSGAMSGVAYRSLNGRARTHLCVSEVGDDAGMCLFSRVWLPLGRTLQAIEPTVGERLAFTAMVVKQLDGTYQLIRPTHYERGEREAAIPG